MQNSVENKEIRIAFLKALHILRQTFCGSFCVCRTNTRIVPIAYLYNVFIKALAFISRFNDIVARCVWKNIAKISVFNTAVSSFLLFIIAFHSLCKTLVISLCYGYLYKCDISTGTGAVNVFRLERAVIVCKTALALTMWYCFRFQYNPSFRFIFY